jgi:lysozyme
MGEVDMRVMTQIAAPALAGVLALAACATAPETPSAPPAAPSAPSAPAAPTGRVGPPYAGLRTNDAIVDLIKAEEGLRLEAYQGPSGAWLIGYGHAGDDVRSGQRIDASEADKLLRADLGKVEDAIKGMLTAPVNEDEFSAMVDLAYNIGTGNFRESTVLKEVNAGDRSAAAEAFLLWNKVTVNGVRRVSPVLEARREREKAMFLGQEMAPREPGT